MAEKPILFNTPMVRAILEGRKTVTRRVAKPKLSEALAYIFAGSNHGKWSYSPYDEERYDEHRKANDWKYWSPPFYAGDILWVRETWTSLVGSYLYRADQKPGMKNPGKWCPSIHMPREAARIFLRVTDVRVERLQEMRAEDSLREGVKLHLEGCLNGEAPLKPFADLWDSTIKPADRDRYGWAANPWVWVISFERYDTKEAGR